MITIIDKDNDYNQEKLYKESILNYIDTNGNIVFKSDRYIYNEQVNENIQLNELKYKIQIFDKNNNIINEYYIPILYLEEFISGFYGISNIELHSFIKKLLNTKTLDYKLDINYLYSKFSDINSPIKVYINEDSPILYKYFDNIKSPLDINDLLFWIEPDEQYIETDLYGNINKIIAKYNDFPFTPSDGYNFQPNITDYENNLKLTKYKEKTWFKYKNNDINEFRFESNLKNKLYSTNGMTIIIIYRNKYNSYYELLSKSVDPDNYFKVATSSNAVVENAVSESITIGLGSDIQMTTFRYLESYYFKSSKDHMLSLTSNNAVRFVDDETKNTILFKNVGVFPDDLLIGDILVYDRFITDEELYSLKGYLMDKYNMYREELNIQTIKSIKTINYLNNSSNAFILFNNYMQSKTNNLSSETILYTYFYNDIPSQKNIYLEGSLSNDYTFYIYEYNANHINDFKLFYIDKQNLYVSESIYDSTTYQVYIDVKDTSGTLVDEYITVDQFKLAYLSQNKITNFNISNFNFEFKDSCLNDNMLKWLNKNGGYDMYNFELIRKDEVSVKDKGYYAQFNYNTTEIIKSNTNESYVSYDKKENRIFTLRTNWLNYSEVEFLDDLFASQEIYFKLDSNWISVKNLMNKSVIYNKQNRGLQRYEFKVELAKPKIIV